MVGPALVVAITFVLLLDLIAVLLLVRRLRPVQRAEVEELADLADLDVTVDNVALLVDSVARTRLWRTVGVLSAALLVVAAMVVEVAADHRLSFQWTYALWLLVGYWAGAVVAELRTAQVAAAAGPRAASLDRRSMESYVGPWAVRWPVVLGVLGLAAVVVSLAVGGFDVWVLLTGFGAAVVAVVHRLVSRYVLERSRPSLAPDVAAADDAVRSRSLHAIGGASVGIGVWTASLAVSGAVLTIVARVEGDDLADLATGAGPAGLVLLVILGALVVPLAGLFVGRALARRPFPIGRAVAVAEQEPA